MRCWPGKCASCAACLAPAFLIIPILHYLGRRAVASFFFLTLTRRETLWVMAGTALMGLLALR